MDRIYINKDAVISQVKPMNCVNNLPRFHSDIYDKYLKQLKIPYVRLHDSAFLNPKLVDIPAIFPDFDADVEDPNSYDFAFTDHYVKQIVSINSKPFFRLGVSIENYQHLKAYYIYPPKDYLKWAKICEHIIAHYNKGWANGFHYGIEYWEIWNEPDNYPDIKDNQMWKGTFEQYLELYEVASNYLKGKFPEIKIGGYSSCGFYHILEQKTANQANASSRTEYFVECFEKFLKYVSSKEHRSPLDFFSWHSYSDVKSNIKYTVYVREMLDKYGFKDTENILNEWNPGLSDRGTLKDASNICANMITLQKHGLDMLMYYDFRYNTDYCGAFTPLGHKPLKAYYSFKYFAELASYKNIVETSVMGEGLYALSSYNGKRGALLFTNNSDRAKEVSIQGDIKIKKVNCISRKPIYSDNVFTLKPYEVVKAIYE